MSKHLRSTEPFIQKLYEDNVKWKLISHVSLTINIPPYNTLTHPLFHPAKINVQHSPNRPKGQIILKCQTAEPSWVKEFCRTARMSSVSALKTLESKPNMAKELTFKLEEDVRNGILVSLEDFLQLPEAKESWINARNCDASIIPSPLHLVTNVNSSSSPLRMCGLKPSKQAHKTNS